jgi:hypothetical protein
VFGDWAKTLSIKCKDGVQVCIRDANYGSGSGGIKILNQFGSDKLSDSSFQLDRQSLGQTFFFIDLNIDAPVEE